MGLIKSNLIRRYKKVLTTLKNVRLRGGKNTSLNSYGETTRKSRRKYQTRYIKVKPKSKSEEENHNIALKKKV